MAWVDKWVMGWACGMGMHALPIVDVEAAIGGVHRPWKRARTADDLPRVAARFGEDLLRADLDALPRAWISLPSARRANLKALCPERC